MVIKDSLKVLKLCYNINMAKLILTSSQFGVIPCLNSVLQGVNQLSEKNIIFCEEKISLMVERSVCSAFGGSFNTKVYSFNKYSKNNNPNLRLLSKEGSAMVVKRVLNGLKLKRLNSERVNLAPVLYDLILQLKSAGITLSDLKLAYENSSGLLSEKLQDIYVVFNEYQKFLRQSEYSDQSTILSNLPEIIRNSEEIKESNVYIVGFNGFTVQVRNTITELLRNAKSVTAILVRGNNNFAYVNESAYIFKNLCNAEGISLNEQSLDGLFNIEGSLISESLFNPKRLKRLTKQDGRVFYSSYLNVFDECLGIAESIKTNVMKGKCRYRDCTIALPDVEEYKDAIKQAFTKLNIPYFLDEKKVALSHPLVCLIVDYIDVFRKNFEGETVKSFYKNPIITSDKNLTDDFENYILKYNVNYARIKTPFTLKEEGEDIDRLENFRKYICGFFDKFDVFNMLKGLQVEQRLNEMSKGLEELGYAEENAVNEQIYDAVTGILQEMQSILGDTEVSLNEYKNIFISGILALKLSIIPQYNDAVFVGEYKESSLCQVKYLYAPGLTEKVPNYKEDVLLLNDEDINSLAQIKVLVEPKIKILNQRIKESLTQALCSFTDGLYLSYPIASLDGKENLKSEVLNYLLSIFKTTSFGERNGYLTFDQGLYTFSRECGEFADGSIDENNDFIKATSFYRAVDNRLCEDLLENANKEIKIRLDSCREIIIGSVSYPTSIEDYYKCPYRSFITHGLSVKERKQNKTDGQFIGNLMHDIFKSYLSNIEKVTDKESSDILFDEILVNIKNSNEYLARENDASEKISMERALNECKKFCYLNFINSQTTSFTTSEDDLEVRFGKGAKYPPISLLDGKVNLSGKIDRIDKCGDYFRIIDYKTGSIDSTEKSLFAGVKLQLYLYAAVIKDKQLAGTYYMPINDSYKKADEKVGPMVFGKSLNESDVLLMQDSRLKDNKVSEFNGAVIKDGKVSKATDRETLNSFIDYAIKMSESASRQMSDGIIVPSPYDETCQYCEFYSMCKVTDEEKRQVESVDEEIIKDSIIGGK